YTIAAVILGIALSILPFGALSDRISIHPIILTGGLVVAAAGLLCSLTHSLWLLIGARFIQGLFIPALTTCLAAYLAKTLPIERLNVVMGAYVSATVVGGLSGRLLGGWIHPPLDWRYAFVSAAALTLLATFAAVRILPAEKKRRDNDAVQPSFRGLLSRWDLMRLFLTGAGGFFVFSSVFNYLPFRLASEPFSYSTETITLLYLVYLVGAFTGPVAGKLSTRYGCGNTLIGGTVLLGAAVASTLIPSGLAVVVSLVGTCAGFFATHAAAVGGINRKLSIGQGRANALYVLFYYLGGWCGITLCGFAYSYAQWQGVVASCLIVLVSPLIAGLVERRSGQN
ncbi:MAG: MFS transporter, partial [Pseudomonadota bacterium]